MQVKTVVVGSYQENCYIVKDEKTGKALIIDPGIFSSELEKSIDSMGIDKFEYILLTHGHSDHICGVPYVKKKYGGQVVIGEESEICLKEFHFLEKNTDYERAFIPSKADIYCSEDLELSIGDIKIKMILTPGHMQGEYCFLIDDILFSGDVLFNGAIGRPDLEGGNIFKLIRSLKKIVTLNDNIKVYSGHGEPTTIGYEKAHNPYIERIV